MTGVEVECDRAPRLCSATSRVRIEGLTINASLQAVLTESERLLVTETEAARLAPLDEDATAELHTRIRRARNKYVGQYRRGASSKVEARGGRGKARPENRRAAMKAEAFEEALARVSRRLAVLARQSAARLRRERLDAARVSKTGRAPGSAKPSAGPSRSKGIVPGPRLSDDRAARTPGLAKRRATSRAMDARKQAKKDNR